MKKSASSFAAIALLATFGVGGSSIGFVDTAEASNYGHKSSRSLAGRAFQIHGTWVVWNDDPAVRPADFINCYTFQNVGFPDFGTWIDPDFPNGPGGEFVPGTWVQHTGGFLTRYTAFANALDPFGAGIDARLIQNGIVIPTFRRGKLRLNAYSTVILNFGGGGAGDFVLGVVLSRGHSVDSCD